jgi:aryl-alcohol dehydrogenase-like predicted oxidoreductase
MDKALFHKRCGKGQIQALSFSGRGVKDWGTRVHHTKAIFACRVLRPRRRATKLQWQRIYLHVSSTIPLRNFGKADVKISALGLGGHHLGAAKDEATAVEIVHRALDGGITFYDCCWEYNRGKSEDWLGKGLRGVRDRAFLMTKVCTHGRDASLAMQMLEQSLRRLQTDHLDLWQIHGVSFQNDAREFIRPNGAAEALRKAKEQGKVRFVGFTGHKDPDIHLAMLDTGFPFDAVQMPLNPFDASFFSFEQKVLPVLNRRGIAALGMKPIGGHGEPVQKGVFTAKELLQYAMSLPVATTISGVSEMPILEQNLNIAQGFTPLSTSEMQALRERAKPYAGDGHFELYKTSIKFDNPEARIAHQFPLDMEQVEVKQMVYATQNTGRPFPQVSD